MGGVEGYPSTASAAGLSRRSPWPRSTKSSPRRAWPNIYSPACWGCPPLCESGGSARWSAAAFSQHPEHSKTPAAGQPPLPPNKHRHKPHHERRARHAPYVQGPSRQSSHRASAPETMPPTDPLRAWINHFPISLPTVDPTPSTPLRVAHPMISIARALMRPGLRCLCTGNLHHHPPAINPATHSLPPFSRWANDGLTMDCHDLDTVRLPDGALTIGSRFVLVARAGFAIPWFRQPSKSIRGQLQ